MLDIVQSFPLLSYCIMSPIYISPICDVENIIFCVEIIKLGILYFSLFTVYIFTMNQCKTHEILSSNSSL